MPYRYKKEEISEYIKAFEKSGLTQAEFARQQSLHPATLNRWLGEHYGRKIAHGSKRPRLPETLKTELVEEFFESGMNIAEFARSKGYISRTVLHGLIMKDERYCPRHSTASERKEKLEKLFAGSENLSQFCKNEGLRYGTVHGWLLRSNLIARYYEHLSRIKD